MKIAVLLTCHNRRDKTISSFSALFSNVLLNSIELNVYLVDDGSTDGTSNAVKEKFPQVKIIQGNGNLFWNKRMRLAWETATKEYDYDFYMWLNDDTILDKNAIINLLENYSEAKQVEDKEAIIVGTCRKSDGDNTFSYGGRNEVGPVLPNGKLQECKYMNGNVVLVPKEAYKILGNLSDDYTHAMGDFDY